MTKMNGVYVWMCCKLKEDLVNGAGMPNNRRMASTLAGKVWQLSTNICLRSYWGSTKQQAPHATPPLNVRFDPRHMDTRTPLWGS